MSQDVDTLITTLPAFLNFVVSAGMVAGALFAIVKLWQAIRPSFKSDMIARLDSLKSVFSKDMKELKEEVEKEQYYARS